MIRETIHPAVAPLFDRRLKEDRDYWLARLSPPPEPVDLGLDRRAAPRGPATAGLELPESAREALAHLTGGSPFLICTALLTVLAICLSRLSGRRRVAVGTPALRNAEGPPPAPNALVILVEVAPERTFRELLLQTRSALLAACERQNYPFALLLADLGLEAADGRCPLFDVALVVAEIHAELPAAGHSLTLRFSGTGGQLAGCLEVRPGRFGSADPERFATRFRQALAAALGSQATPVGNLGLLTEVELHQVLREWNDTARAYPSLHVLHRLIEAQVDRTPEAVAVTAEEGRLTYRELDRRANRLARRLRGLGVGPDVPVGIYLERSLELVVGLLGALKAGGAYVPLDPGYPRERVELMLADSGAPVVLTLAGLADGVPGGDAKVVLLDDLAADTAESGERLDGGADADHLAYVIYTSGSTGQPKGVMVTHANAVRLLRATERWFGFGPDDVWTLFHSAAFDFSVWELWGALAYGGRLVMVPYWISRSPDLFYRLLAEQRVTVLNQTPSAFRQLIWAEEKSSPDELALRWVIFGGEALDLSSLAPWIGWHGDTRPALVNMYGITETTVHVTFRPITGRDVAESRGSVIGRPIPDLRVYVADAALALVPADVQGEILVGGAGLARGYLGRPELTAERFVPDPFSGEPGARLYRSGDLARRLSDGDLEYLGRIDHQVKLRGFRIELGEIEAAIERHPAVKAAVVLARQDGPGGQRLVAYVVPAAPAADLAGELRRRLAKALPDYMVPAAFVQLDALPLTANGKLDRRALPAPAGGNGGGEGPLGPTEEVVASVWESVLGVPRVGAGDDFFALGGHSLLATQVAARLRTLFRVDLPVVRLFEKRTVAALSGEIARLRGGGEVCDEIARLFLQARDLSAGGGATDLLAPAQLARFESLLADRGLDVAAVGEIPRGGVPGPAPLSLAQESLWFLQQVEGEGATYNLLTAVRLAGSLDRAVLERSAAEIVRRHETLRTSFRVDGGVPVQVVAPAAAPSLALLDLAGLPAAARDREILRLARSEAGRPFDLTRGPLARMTLARLGHTDHVLVLTCHHIVSDGWSLGIFVRELAALYRAFAEGRPSPLPEPILHYRDFARWQRDWLQGDVLATQLAYWRRKLADAPRLRLPTDHPRPRVQTTRGATLPLRIAAPFAAALRALCGQERATLFMGLLAGFKVLLRACTGQDDVVVGSDIANRSRREMEGLIGFFVNSLVLRTDLGGDPTFRELLARVRETTLGAYAHQDLPFTRLVEELRPARDRSHSPLFQVTLSLHNFPRHSEAGGGLTMNPLPVHGGSAKFDLSLFLAESDDEIEGLLEYNVDLFAEATASRMLEHYRAVLTAVAADPDRRLSELSTGGADRAAMDAFNEDLEVY